MTAPHRPQLPGGDRAPAPRTLWDVLTATAAENPDAPALDDGTQVLEYTDLVERAEACADRLARAGSAAVV